tara:strand:- start:62 stop:583 length:522 start_codon:yes stop_codon:yes gene_type:complete
MEKKLNNKVGHYVRDFKDELKKYILQNNFDTDEGKLSFIEWIYGYPIIEITSQDLQKRKRVKNVVPFCYRCKAKRANGEQCSRRKKDNTTDFCGTHIKGTPHGRIETSEQNDGPNKKKVKVWTEEIMGITYFIDNFNNVYNPHEIMNNVENPHVIAKWEKNEQDNYIIPSLLR